MEKVLVDYHEIFARKDNGMSKEFKARLTPKTGQAAYSQNMTIPIHLKGNFTSELALMHKYGIITVFPFSKYASSNFADKKPNRKRRFFVDLRKTNNLIADDYTNNNRPVRSLSDAAEHLAGKSLFCKLDCSRAYHCLQMANQRSVETFAFTFVSRIRAY